jgi:hypothetical protein
MSVRATKPAAGRVPRGTYRLARNWQFNPALEGGPFDRRSAWVWMIEKAEWTPRKRNVGGRTIELARGQFSASCRFLAQAWGWSEATVRRFLARLVTDGMIVATTDAGQYVVTLVNYDVYQLAVGFGDAADDAGATQGATQPRTKTDAAADASVGAASGGDERRNADVPSDGDAARDAKLTQGRRSDDANNKGRNEDNERNPSGEGAHAPEPELGLGGGLNGEVLPPAGKNEDPKTVLFRDGLAYLTANGVPERQARKLLARWRQDHGDQHTIDAVGEARRVGASEPISFIISVLKKPPRNANGRGRRSVVMDGLNQIYKGGQDG